MSDELKYLSERVVRGLMDRRAFMGRAAALGAGATLAGSMLSSAAFAAGPQKGGILKAGMVGGESTNSLDPATFASQVPFALGRCWGDTLVETSPTGEVNNRLAEEVSSSPDARVWTFKIRSGVTFHNGKTLDAADVVATLKRHSDEESKSGALGIMRDIDSITQDGRNVVVALKSANADLPYLMSDYHLIIQPNGGMDAPDAGIGTGPYKIVVNEPGVRHVGERFADYWDAPNRGHAEQIEIIVINDATARTAALQGGQVHMINRVEPKIVDLVKRVPGVTIQNVGGRGHYVFIMHCNTAPFDNNDLRLALKYAMDREQMVDKILRGYGTVGNDMPINAAYPLFDDSFEQRAYDPDKAKFHFKKSGHDGSVLLRTSDVAFPGAVDASQLYQESCQKAGIKLEIKREPGDGYWSEVWNKQPFCTSYWGGRATQDQMYSTAYLSTADWNDTKFKRPDFDALLNEAKAELDQAKRKDMYFEVQELIHNESGTIIPVFASFIHAAGPKFGHAGLRGNWSLDNHMVTRTGWLKS